MTEPQDVTEGPAGSAATPVACASCGATPEDAAHALLTWSRATEKIVTSAPLPVLLSA